MGVFEHSVSHKLFRSVPMAHNSLVLIRPAHYITPCKRSRVSAVSMSFDTKPTRTEVRLYLFRRHPSLHTTTTTTTTTT